MCGIIAYVGPQPCAQLLIDGLRMLEYRGYDSAGLAVHDGTSIVLRRAAGKLSALQELLTREPLAGSTGIGHTRWATHGPPSERNAHPHVSGKVAVVHNGIIENHVELKHRLETLGRVFSSDTDTEIVAHLVDLAMTRGLTLVEAVRDALRELRGAYAIAVMSNDSPNTIVVAKHASPLVLAYADNAVLAASDVPAILAHTRDVVFLEDGEIAILHGNTATIETLAGESVTRAPTTIRWSLVQAERGGYKHFMLKEIHEQPRAIEDTLRGRIHLESGKCIGEELGVTESLAKDTKRIILLGCGTSFHAAVYGRYLLEELARVPTTVELASEFRYRRPVILPGDLIVAVSQSGETADTLAALKEARLHGAKVLSVVNVQGSAIARASDGVLYTHAGPEIGVASTKCFTAQLAAMALLAVHFGVVRGALSPERSKSLLAELVKVPEKMRDALDRESVVQAIARDISPSQNALFLGRGVSFPVALEGALKLKEISYVHAEGYAGGEMKHGPLALVDRSMPVICVLPEDDSLEKMLSNVQEVRAREGRVLAIVNNPETAKNLAQWSILVSKTAPEFSPLITTIPLQLLSYHVADQRGTDVDQPRNLAKTVTVE